METIINTKVVVNFQKSLMVAKRRIEINDNDKLQSLDQKINHKRKTLTKILMTSYKLQNKSKLKLKIFQARYKY